MPLRRGTFQTSQRHPRARIKAERKSAKSSSRP
jgi:hypothetical protein